MRQLALDCLGVGGLGLVLAGVHRMSPAAAMVIGGLAAVGLAVALTLRGRGANP